MNAKEILEELSNIWRTPEAQDFYSNILEKNYKKARKLLLEITSEKKADILIQFYIDKSENKFDLVEVDVKNLIMFKNNNNDKEVYLFKISDKIVQSVIYIENEGQFFYTNEGLMSVNKANQIWKITNRTQ